MHFASHGIQYPFPLVVILNTDNVLVPPRRARITGKGGELVSLHQDKSLRVCVCVLRFKLTFV